MERWPENSSPLAKGFPGGADGCRYFHTRHSNKWPATNWVDFFGMSPGQFIRALRFRPTLENGYDQKMKDNPFQEWIYDIAHQDEEGDLVRDADNTSSTVRLPYNRTDSDLRSISIDRYGKPRGYPSLTTSILRHYQFGASDLAVCKVEVADPESGTRIELFCTPLTASYRGARQHWALVSASRPADPPAGDRYSGP